MVLYKIIAIIISLWFIKKVIRFISAIKITSSKLDGFDKKNSRKSKMDIKDADYEDVE
mgnify:CR=1 FL=1